MMVLFHKMDCESADFLIEVADLDLALGIPCDCALVHSEALLCKEVESPLDIEALVSDVSVLSKTLLLHDLDVLVHED